MRKIFISKKCIKHSNVGDFIKSNGKIIMKNGGHGQDNLDYLRKNGLESIISVTYNNGVRLGSVPCHKSNSHRTGTKQGWFPSSWTSKDIKNAGKYVMSLKKNKKRKNQKPYQGTYKGVKVGTYTKKGFVTTIYPWYVQKGG